MLTAKKYVDHLKKKPGQTFSFAAVLDKKELVFVGSNKDSVHPKALESELLKKHKGAKAAALGSGKVNGDACELFCLKKTAAFSNDAVKKAFTAIPIKIVIRSLDDGAAAAPVNEAAVAPVEAAADGGAGASDDEQNNGGGAPEASGDPITIDESKTYPLFSMKWGPRLADAIQKNVGGGATQQHAALISQFRSAQERFEVTVPEDFLRALKQRKAVAAAQKLVDDLRVSSEMLIAKAAKALADKPENADRILQAVNGKAQEMLGAIVQKHWDKFVTRYEVGGSYETQKWVTVGTIAASGIAAAGGIATSGGVPLALVPAVIGAVRTVTSAFEAYRLHFRELAAAVSSVEQQSYNLRIAYRTDKDTFENNWTDYAAMIANSFASTKVGETFPGVVSDVDTLRARISSAEIAHEKVVAALTDAIDEHTKLDAELAGYRQKALSGEIEEASYYEAQGKVAKLGKALSESLDQAIDKISKVIPSEKNLTKVEDDLKALRDALGKSADNMELADKVISGIVAALTFGTNLGTGIATAGDAIGATAVAIGAAADGIDGIRLKTG